VRFLYFQAKADILHLSREGKVPDHDLQDYLFDLNGFLIFENIIDAAYLAALNATFDAFAQDVNFGAWRGAAAGQQCPRGHCDAKYRSYGQGV
jgi:hypothetical protein